MRCRDRKGGPPSPNPSTVASRRATSRPSFFRLSVAVAVAESSGYFRFRERSFYLNVEIECLMIILTIVLAFC